MKKRQRETSGAGWSPVVQWIVSGMLAFHILAVFMPPFAFQTAPVQGMGSPVADAALQVLAPYVDLMYLNHGYAFFAPDPGPSHLVRAKLEFADGREATEITFPDLERHWPRLLYHRYFMLSEHLHGAFVPEEPPQDLVDATQPEEWQFVRRMYEARRTAIEEHIKARSGADRVTLQRIEHRLLQPFEFVSLGKRPGDADTYVELSETIVDEEAP